jgi:hypothetical protein
MANHKFTYTVSGVDLNSEQKAAISREIGAAVTRALIGPSPQPVRSDFLTLTKIYGGIWIDPTLFADETVGQLEARTAT